MTEGDHYASSCSLTFHAPCFVIPLMCPPSSRLLQAPSHRITLLWRAYAKSWAILERPLQRVALSNLKVISSNGIKQPPLPPDWARWCSSVDLCISTSAFYAYVVFRIKTRLQSGRRFFLLLLFYENHYFLFWMPVSCLSLSTCQMNEATPPSVNTDVLHSIINLIASLDHTTSAFHRPSTLHRQHIHGIVS